MPGPDEIAEQQKILETHRRALALLLEQHAQFGALYVPPYIVFGIEQHRAEIQRIKAELRACNLAVEDRPGDEGPTPSVAAASEQARAGLTALADLAGAPDVRGEVIAFQESFGLACRQIDLLDTYKTLHDLLHDLQFKCYRPILSGARDFPTNELFRESLTYHASDLQQIVNSLWELAERTGFPASEQVWIRQLNQAAELLDAAIQESSREQLERATFQIERVLGVHPTRINERLKDAARDLPLDSLIKAMTAVRDHLLQTARAPDRLGQIEQGVAALEQIRDSLAGLIGEHDTWQMFDPALRQFEDRPEQHIQQLAWLWQDLKPAVASLCGDRSDRWSQDLRQASEKLDRALAAQASDGIAGPFHTFRSRFSLCFFRADKELKEQCFKLRLVDGPLRSVMGVLG